VSLRARGRRWAVVSGVNRSVWGSAKAGARPNELEPAVFQLVASVIRKFRNVPRLEGHHAGEVKAGGFHAQSPHARAPDQVPHFRRLQQCLGRHAAAQDAQAATSAPPSMTTVRRPIAAAVRAAA
jgi:hypothetical protein